MSHDASTAVFDGKHRAKGGPMDQDEYPKERLDGQIAFCEKAASRAKSWHMRYQIGIILLGLAVPVVVNLPKEVVPGEAGGI
jgi:hypothetical protein